MTGTITGVGLDPAKDPEAYGTALIIDVNTGETIGFQLISPTGAIPMPFSVPYDPSTIDPNASYVARGSDLGRDDALEHATRTPVLTNDNPKPACVLTVVPAVTTSASPQPAPDPAAPAAGHLVDPAAPGADRGRDRWPP